MVLNSDRFWETNNLESDDRVFVIHDGCCLTYKEVFEKSDMLFKDRPRGVLAILCDKSINTIIAYFGALRNGHVALMLSSDMRPASLERLLIAYSPDFIFDPQGTFNPQEFKIMPQTVIAEFGVAKLFASDLEQKSVLNENLAVLLGTSGSTGDPKFVRLSYNSLDVCTKSICEYLALGPERRSVSLLPFHYSYGLSVLNTVAASRSSIVLSDFSILDRKFRQLVSEWHITDMAFVPFMLEILRRAPFPDEVMDILQCVTQAGGRLDPDLTQFFQETFASANVRYFTMYGQTEASPRISYLSPEMASEKVGSVGRPISCGRALIAETGEDSGEGELLYIGENVALGYAKSREDLSLGDQFSGKLLTGDRARIDEDGYIFIIGRLKRFVKVHGVSVNLDHVEDVLKQHDIDCFVVGRENLIVICYSEQGSINISDLIRNNFALHPSNIRVKKLDSLPFGANGKPDYQGLSDRFL